MNRRKNEPTLAGKLYGFYNAVSSSQPIYETSLRRTKEIMYTIPAGWSQYGFKLLRESQNYDELNQ